MKVYDQTVIDALDTLLDGRTRDQWLTLIEIVEELTQAYNENPIRLSTRGLNGSTIVRWFEYVDHNRARGFTYRDVARVLEREGYARGMQSEEKRRMPNIHVPTWGPRR